MASNFCEGVTDARDDMLRMVEKIKKLIEKYGKNENNELEKELQEAGNEFLYKTKSIINYENCNREYCLGFIHFYRAMAFKHTAFSLKFPSFSDDMFDKIEALVIKGYKFSGRKKDRLRQEVRDYGLRLKQELLQRGKSNREANTIVIDRLEQHPIYGNYVKDLGKEALRKLLQIPKTPKEKNGK